MTENANTTMVQEGTSAARAEDVTIGNALLRDRFRVRLRAEMLRIPGSEYRDYLNGIADPDLESTVLVEIPAYKDPELMPTIRAALAMAANPDRIHFSICLQDDDPEKLEALYAVPHCRVKYYPSDEAPGLCAVRYDCQQLLDGEDFVFHVDSHMRFAQFWDVAMIGQWWLCGNDKAVVSDCAKAIGPGELDLPVDDPTFTEGVDMYCGVLNASFFTHNLPELRLRVSKLYESDRPLLGAFISGHCLFGKAVMDRTVPSDPKMEFVADEHTVAARLWTHGFDIYHANARCVYHLYNRARREDTAYAPPRPEVKVEGGLTRWERQARRMEKLFGVYDRQDTDLSGFDLGTERSLADYQAFCGVDFRDLTIGRFAAYGRFDVEHGPEDMEFQDWAKQFEGRESELRDTSAKLDLNVRPDAAEEFLRLCAETHVHPQAALTEAVRQATGCAAGFDLRPAGGPDDSGGCIRSKV